VALRIVDQEIEDHETEHGVRFDDGFVCICNDEDEARATRQMTGGEIVTREVYMTPWTEVSP
jgi:ribosomal protein L14